MPDLTLFKVKTKEGVQEMMIARPGNDAKSFHVLFVEVGSKKAYTICVEEKAKEEKDPKIPE